MVDALNVTYRYPGNLDLPTEVSGSEAGAASRADINEVHNSLRNLADSFGRSVSTVSTSTDALTFATPNDVNMVFGRANYNSVSILLPANLAEWNGRTIVFKALVVAVGYTLTLDVPPGADYNVDEILTSVSLKAYEAITLKHIVGNTPPIVIESSHLFDLSTAIPPVTFAPEVRP